MEAKPIGLQAEDLKLDDVLRILQNREPSCVCSVPPVKPKGGEMYVFCPGDDQSKSGKCENTAI